MIRDKLISVMVGFVLIGVFVPLIPMLIRQFFPAFDPGNIPQELAVWVIVWLASAILAVQTIRLGIDLKHYQAIRNFNQLLELLPKAEKEFKQSKPKKAPKLIPVEVEPVKRKRGRPPKAVNVAILPDKSEKPKKKNLLYTT